MEQGPEYMHQEIEALRLQLQSARDEILTLKLRLDTTNEMVGHLREALKVAMELLPDKGTVRIPCKGTVS